MDNKKQKILIEYLISSPDTFAICQGILKSEFFDPELRNSVSFIQSYYDKYDTTPSVDQIEAESSVVFKKRDIALDEVKYCTTEIETFCRRRAIEKAVLSSPELIAKGDYGTLETNIKDAVLLSLNSDLGTNYFEDVKSRLEKMLNDDPVVATGWDEVDELLQGGIARKELLLFSANSGGGKSITMSNLAYNFVSRGYDVLYITLELAQEIVSQRVDTMLTGFGRKDWKEHVNEIIAKVESEKESGVGQLTFKYMPTSTQSIQIRALLKEYYLHHKKYPDMLVVDYLDKMAPNEMVSADNVFEKDKRCAEQLRQIGVDYNMFIVTASQLNREAVKAVQHDHSHIAGGISKVNESDVYISIKMTDAMRAQGEMMFSFQKTRNSDGVGKNVYLKWDNKRLMITNKEGSSASSSLNFVKRVRPDKTDFIDMPAPTGDGLLDLLSST